MVSNLKEEMRRKMEEKEEEVRLALEERELQKMAAVTGLDEQKDELLRKIETLNSVSYTFRLCTYPKLVHGMICAAMLDS